MTKSLATRTRAARKVAAKLLAVTTMRDHGLQKMPGREVMRQLAADIRILPPSKTARDTYDYRANKTSRNTRHGQKARIARYAGFGSERRLMLFRQAVGQQMIGDIHAERRRAHIIQAGVDAGDAWALEVVAAQRGARG